MSKFPLEAFSILQARPENGQLNPTLKEQYTDLWNKLNSIAQGSYSRLDNKDLLAPFKRANPHGGRASKKYFWCQVRRNNRKNLATSISFLVSKTSVKIYLEWDKGHSKDNPNTLNNHNNWVNYVDEWAKRSNITQATDFSKYYIWVVSETDGQDIDVNPYLKLQDFLTYPLEKRTNWLDNVNPGLKGRKKSLWYNVGVIYKFEDLEKINQTNQDIEDIISEAMTMIEGIYHYTDPSNITKVNKKVEGTKISMTTFQQLNKIFYGPPGTGKTYRIIEEAVSIVNPDFEGFTNRKVLVEEFKRLQKKGQIRFITFHQSYSYEEFVEGYRFVKGESQPVPVDGVFKKFCIDAAYASLEGVPEEYLDPNNKKTVLDNYNNHCLFIDSTPKYVLIIDEINRGNISKIFGELITAIEPDKRLGETNFTPLTLPYSLDTLSVPKNLFILGTMNTTDRSIALMDVALRRRFFFEKIVPDVTVIQNLIENEKVDQELVQSLVHIFNKLNSRLQIFLGEDYQIGHSYFLNVRNIYDLHRVWYNQILPLLLEYFYNDWDKLERVLDSRSNQKLIIPDKPKKNIFYNSDFQTEFSEDIEPNLKKHRPCDAKQLYKLLKDL